MFFSGKQLIEEIEVSKEQGQVQIYFKHSANVTTYN